MSDVPVINEIHTDVDALVEIYHLSAAAPTSEMCIQISLIADHIEENMTPEEIEEAQVRADFRFQLDLDLDELS